MMISGGSINVAGDLLVAPGSAGQAAVGSNAYAGSFYLVRSPLLEWMSIVCSAA
jgi:hypothetical protein